MAKNLVSMKEFELRMALAEADWPWIYACELAHIALNVCHQDAVAMAMNVKAGCYSPVSERGKAITRLLRARFKAQHATYQNINVTFCNVTA